MWGITAVSINDDLAPGNAGITHWSADNESAGRVDMHFGVFVEKVGGNSGLDDLFGYVLTKLFGRYIIGMLRRNNNGLNPERTAVPILDRNLRFTVRSQIGKLTASTNV